MKEPKVLRAEVCACIDELLRRQAHFAAVVSGGIYAGAPPGKTKRARLARGRASERLLSTDDEHTIKERLQIVNRMVEIA